MTDQIVSVDRDQAALVVVDVQPDFMEGGALAAQNGSAVVKPIAELMASGRFELIAATQDWHPLGHISFASQHEGRKPFEVIDLYDHEQVLWPDHCVQNSEGAMLHPDLPWEKAAVVVRKGEDPAVDSYSGFLNNWNAAGKRPPTGLAGYLRERGVRDVFVCGLARDFCAKWTAEDAADAGFRTWLLWDLTRPVDATADDSVHASLTASGVSVIDSAQLA